MATRRQPSLLVICGPTASGKSELALKIAKRFGGEIICADSRTIYCGMDIGTAKPSKKDQAEVPHHLLDVAAPDQSFNAHDFQRLAKPIITSIQLRHRLPILVGGTGLYIDSVVFDYQFPAQASAKTRETFAAMSLEKLYEYCEKNFIKLPANEQNKRHVISAILREGELPRRKTKPQSNTIIVGIATEKDILRQKIANRAEYIFSHGVVNEAKKLGEMYGWDNESMTANTYPIAREVLEKNLTLAEAKERSIALDWQLAKRQLTWLKRNPYINWFALDKAEEFLVSSLAESEQ